MWTRLSLSCGMTRGCAVKSTSRFRQATILPCDAWDARSPQQHSSGSSRPRGNASPTSLLRRTCSLASLERLRRRFVERMKFAKVHVFPYSERPGTPAATLPEQVPRQVRDDRARQVRDLATRQRDEFRHRFVGRQLPVLWEKQRHDGRWTGWSDNYLRVVASSDTDLCNRITSARILSVERDYLEGETTV